MNELNLYDLFRNITSKSKMMKRFVVAPGYGSDLNKNNLGEYLEDALGGIVDGVKYPVNLMLPPLELVEDYDKGWTRFKCKFFFLTTLFNDSLGIQDRNPNNNLSMHDEKKTWSDMSRCAKDFKKVFIEVMSMHIQDGIRDVDNLDIIERISEVGNDRLAGVAISFDVDLFMGCEINDYTQEGISEIVFSTENLHQH